MLEMSDKTITIKGLSMVEGVEAASFEAVINSTNPINMILSSSIVNEDEYRNNIVQCRNDENEFRAYAQSLQDEFLAEANTQEV